MTASYLNHNFTFNENLRETLSWWLNHNFNICKTIINTVNIEHPLIISHKSSECLYVMAGIHFTTEQSGTLTPEQGFHLKVF